MTPVPAARVPPFGSRPFALDASDYLIDCAGADPTSLTRRIHEQWHARGLVILKGTGMTHLRELADWAKILFDDFAAYAGEALKAQGVRYLRVMQDKHADKVLGYKSWQDTFYTEDRAVAEQAVKANGWEFEWLANGSLRTSHRVDAYEYHEQLRRPLFFAGPASHAAFFDQWHPFNTVARRPATAEHDPWRRHPLEQCGPGRSLCGL
jgi:hypothetical protein